jgi:hypothetical protein
MPQPSARPKSGQVHFSRARAQEGVNDLGRILRDAESSRVLNLSQIDQLWGRREDHLAQPLFENRVLNRSIIMKYAPRPGELFEYAERRIKSTKILFPLDRNDLSLGSLSGVVGQRDFSRIMSRHLNVAERLSERDEKVLNLIDQLPTLDPFLLYALLRSNGLEVSQVYFQVSGADREAIQREMAVAFTPLVLLCCSNGQLEAEAVKTFVDKILNFEESAEVESLRDAFRLSEELFAVAMFAWRGVIYYKWRSASLHSRLGAALHKIRDLTFVETGALSGAGRAERSRTKILQTATTAAARVQEINARYDAAFADFVEQRQADRFRRFLISAPSLFLIGGQSMAILEHIVNFVDTGRSPSRRESGATAPSLAEGFHELERELGVDFGVRLMTW